MKIPTKEQILQASESCPDAKDVLQELFPEVFKEERKKEKEFWGDITQSVEVVVSKMFKGYYLRFMHDGRQIAYSGLGKSDVQFIQVDDSEEDYLVEWFGVDFRILKR